MELKSNRVIFLYLVGNFVLVIVRQLQQFNLNKIFAYRTINRYNATGRKAKRNRGGPKRTAAFWKMIEKLKTRIERNLNEVKRKKIGK